jgi:hypothetical protein
VFLFEIDLSPAKPADFLAPHSGEQSDADKWQDQPGSVSARDLEQARLFFQAQGQPHIVTFLEPLELRPQQPERMADRARQDRKLSGLPVFFGG